MLWGPSNIYIFLSPATPVTRTISSKQNTDQLGFRIPSNHQPFQEENPQEPGIRRQLQDQAAGAERRAGVREGERI